MITGTAITTIVIAIQDMAMEDTGEDTGEDTEVVTAAIKSRLNNHERIS